MLKESFPNSAKLTEPLTLQIRPSKTRVFASTFVQCIGILLKRTEESLYEASTSAFPDILAILAPFFNHQECKVRRIDGKYSLQSFSGVNQGRNRKSTPAFECGSKIGDSNANISHWEL